MSFKGVIEMSNAIGGVPVCVAQPITDSYTGLNLPAGTSTLQGDEALAFLRTRHGVGDGSDLGRISSQQVFLSSLLRTVKSNDTLGSPARLYKLARASASNMQLSQSLNDIGTMVQMGLALRDLPLAQVNFVQYPGTTGGTGVYEGKVEPTTYLADRLFAKIKADQSFSLGADSTGIGSETSPTQPSPTQPNPAPSSPAAVPAPATPRRPRPRRHRRPPRRAPLGDARDHRRARGAVRRPADLLQGVRVLRRGAGAVGCAWSLAPFAKATVCRRTPAALCRPGASDG